jgi:hypothetical protein
VGRGAGTAGVQLLEMSNVSEEGVTTVKNLACDRLLEVSRSVG